MLLVKNTANFKAIWAAQKQIPYSGAKSDL